MTQLAALLVVSLFALALTTHRAFAAQLRASQEQASRDKEQVVRLVNSYMTAQAAVGRANVDALSRAMQATAESVAQSVVATLTPLVTPRDETSADIEARITHAMAEQLSSLEGAVDDTDPTDASIADDRDPGPNAQFIDSTSPMPFGVPGLSIPNFDDDAVIPMEVK